MEKWILDIEDEQLRRTLERYYSHENLLSPIHYDEMRDDLRRYDIERVKKHEDKIEIAVANELADYLAYLWRDEAGKYHPVQSLYDHGIAEQLKRESRRVCKDLFEWFSCIWELKVKL